MFSGFRDAWMLCVITLAFRFHKWIDMLHEPFILYLCLLLNIYFGESCMLTSFYRLRMLVVVFECWYLDDFWGTLALFLKFLIYTPYSYQNIGLWARYWSPKSCVVFKYLNIRLAARSLKVNYKVGALKCWQTWLAAWRISGLMNVNYCKAPTMWQYAVRSSRTSKHLRMTKKILNILGLGKQNSTKKKVSPQLLESILENQDLDCKLTTQLIKQIRNEQIIYLIVWIFFNLYSLCEYYLLILEGNWLMR